MSRPVELLDALEQWAAEQRRSGGRQAVSIRLARDAESVPHWVSVDVEGREAHGRMTVWESGACDTELFSSSGHCLLLRSRLLASPASVAAVADDLVDHLADYCGG